MSEPSEPDDLNPVEVFVGTAWEAGLVESLLENAEITVFIRYGGKGTMAPWDSGGGLPVNRIFVSADDAEKAQEVIRQYYEAMK